MSQGWLRAHLGRGSLRVFGRRVNYEHLILLCLTLFLVADVLSESGVEEPVSRALGATATFLSLIMGGLITARAWALREPLYEGLVTAAFSAAALALRL